MKGIFHFSLSPGKKILGEAVPRGISQLFSVNWACGSLRIGCSICSVVFVSTRASVVVLRAAMGGV